jgi:hypothetical protein
MEKIIIGAISAVAGLLAGLLMPWIKWEVEKSRLKRKEREQRIIKWRSAAEDANFSIKDFLQSGIYSEIRSYLSKDAIASLEAKRKIVSVNSMRPNTEQNILLDEIARLEKEWKLI